MGTQPKPLSHPVVLFDGYCNLCHRSVRWALRHDRRAVLRFAPLESEAGRRLLKTAHLPETPQGVVLLRPDGRAFERSDAWIEICKALGFPWSWLGAWKLLPRPWPDRVYDWIAKNRYRWFGKKDSCPVPEARWRERFLEN